MNWLKVLLLIGLIASFFLLLVYFKKRMAVMPISKSVGIPFKNNFDFTAKCIVFLYRAVCAHPKSADWSEKQRLYAASILDARSYLLADTVRLQDLNISVLCAYSGECNVLPHRAKHCSFFDVRTIEDILVGLVLQLECLLFCQDNTSLSIPVVMDSVISKKSQIIRAVQSALLAPEIPPFFSRMAEQAFSTPDFVNIVLEFKD